MIDFIDVPFFQSPRPTIFPAKKWNKLCATYVTKLDSAMDGIGTDEKGKIEFNEYYNNNIQIFFGKKLCLNCPVACRFFKN